MDVTERGEKGGVILDGGDEGLEPIEDTGGDDAPIAKDQEDNDALAKSGGESDLDGGTEDPGPGEDGESTEGEISENGEGPRPKDDPRIATLEKIVEKLVEKPVETKSLSDEDWKKIEEDWQQPRATIEKITRQNVQIINKMTEYIDSKFARLELNSSIEDFAKTEGFTDASRYKKEISEFLTDYDPKHWSNPKLLQRATFFARGVNANGNIKKVRTDLERNRKIADKARPSAPAGGQRRANLTPLTPIQKQVAEMMPGGEAEYKKYRRQGRVVLE